MFNKNTLILLLLTFNLAKSLKSIDLCILKQKECKGFYNEQENYDIKCDLIKCYGKLNYRCGSNICSKSIIECNEYNKMTLYNKIILESKTNDTFMAMKYLKDKLTFKLFIKHIQICKNKIYEFQSNDFCLREKECKKVNITQQQQQQTDCKCPTNQSFMCADKYCATDSLACDYFKLNENNKYFTNNIIDCHHNDHNVTISQKFNFKFLIIIFTFTLVLMMIFILILFLISLIIFTLFFIKMFQVSILKD
jgi:hypothetical protein